MDNDIVSDYISDSLEHLTNIENDLLTIESQGASLDNDLINKVFRAAHSIKGGAGFLGLHKIKELSHKVENVLGLMRTKELFPSPEIINILLASFDMLRNLINHHDDIEQINVEDLGNALSNLISLKAVSTPADSSGGTFDFKELAAHNLSTVDEYEVFKALQDGHNIYALHYDLIHDLQEKNKNPIKEIKRLAETGLIIDSYVDISAVGSLDDDFAKTLPFTIAYASQLSQEDLSKILEIPMQQIILISNFGNKKIVPSIQQTGGHELDPEKEMIVTPEKSMEEIKMEPKIGPQIEPKVETKIDNTEFNQQQQTERTSSSGVTVATTTSPFTTAGNINAENTLRVNVDLLEELMNLAGELVLGRNQLMNAVDKSDMRLIKASKQKINLVTSELQETIMQTRMQPIGNLFNKFPRVVRNLTQGLHKEIKLVITGKEVDIDKSILEGLSDPLNHMIRNSIDHGIETTEVRKARGKNPAGTIKLNAYHDAGQVVIEIDDDGEGIQTEKIVKKALDKGIINEEQLKNMSFKDKVDLIFLPGLSTAEKITDLSGRGVGMDVVKSNLDHLGGKVEIQSEEGIGTLFKIKLPLTLAIIPSVLVSINRSKFAIPQVNVIELIRIAKEQISERLETLGDSEVIIIREKLVPIIRLNRFLINESPSIEDIAEVNDLNVVIVNTGVQEYGIIVDAIHETLEIVVRPFGKHLKHLKEYMGATILGDGRIATILDVHGLAIKTNILSSSGSSRWNKQLEQSLISTKEAGEIPSFLLFKNSINENCAVNLGLVSRILSIERDNILNLGGKRTVQYQGTSIPLLCIKDVANVADFTPEQSLVMIIFQLYNKEFGLLAARPLDIAEISIQLDQSVHTQNGILGSCIINDQTTLIVNIFEIVETIYPQWKNNTLNELQKVHQVHKEKGGTPTTILLVEDSQFFREQIRKFVEEIGYKVVTAEDGQDAWKVLQDLGNEISLVLTDIEMPKLSGLDLAKKIRAEKNISHIPIIALSALADTADVEKGKIAGINDYQIKLEKEKLLLSIRQMLSSTGQHQQEKTDEQNVAREAA
ncbi:MAG: chemotaxis protein CheW [Oligoflexia bacterium]|nr:chemotaxis protein CheW [Oligoflexia bacterium]